MSGTLSFSPFLPVMLIAVFASISFILCFVIAWQSGSGVFWRMLSVLIIALMLLNPEIVDEDREPQRNVVPLIVDRSSSQKIGDRTTQTDIATREMRGRLQELGNIDIREVIVRDTLADTMQGAEEGSLLLRALRQTFGQIPKNRISGAIIISDGQAHDEDLIERITNPNLPVHLLLTGEPNESDRRLIIEKAPAFGIVGKNAIITYKVEDRGPLNKDSLDKIARVTIKDGDETIAESQIKVGQVGSFSIPLAHAGVKVFKLEVARAPNELSDLNNHALVAINGVRERLRVLLVSGQPHAGERVWRNLLKSDPAVDLVHFTILRPPEKDDFTPVNEISLIAFPTRELFETKIKEFDLVVFDRYVVRDVLPPSYLRNILKYVREGGALLLAVGPEFATERSLFNTPLGEILPVAPTGNVIQKGFRPKITKIGNRHPITATLPRAPGARANRGAGEWGRWFRQIEAAANAGLTLMEGSGNRPLLVLDRSGMGRVATILSDHFWLWARGFENGGPHAELMRRLAHWLMQEPDLEEEQLKANFAGGKLYINLRSLSKTSTKITVTKPTGDTESYPLAISDSGMAELIIPAVIPGLYKINDGQRVRLAAAGSLNPIEFGDLRSTSEILSQLTNSTGGGIHRIRDGLPDLRLVRPDRDRSGKGWLGLIDNRAHIVTGLTKYSLVPPLLYMISILMILMITWWREGR